MRCQHCTQEIKQPKRGQKYCSQSCRYAAWEATHRLKRKHPKRERRRERERLYTLIHKGESLDDLRRQALEAAHVRALREAE